MAILRMRKIQAAATMLEYVYKHHDWLSREANNQAVETDRESKPIFFFSSVFF